MEKIILDVGGLSLDSVVFDPGEMRQKNPAILFVHGWTSCKERSFQYAEVLSKLGFICFLFDMRGHGKSEGDIKSFTNRDFFEDVLGAYDYLSKIEGVDIDNISAVGSSFGGYLVALLSKKRKLKNISLRVPADYDDSDFDKLKYKNTGFNNPEVMKWRNTKRSFDETSALAAIHEFAGKIQILEAEKDTIVPHRIIQNYIDAVTDKSKLTYVILKDAPHSAKEQKHKDEIEKQLIAFFSNFIK